MIIDPKRKVILDKICKLMELADSSTYEGEANQARHAVAKLLAKYQVNQSELRKDQQIVTVKRNHRNLLLENWECMLINVLAKHVGVYYFKTRGNDREMKYFKSIGKNPREFPDICAPKIWFVGREADIEVANYMVDNVLRQIQSLVKAKSDELRREGFFSQKRIVDYRNGLILSINNNLIKLSEEVMSYKSNELNLVPVDENKVRVEEAEKKAKQDIEISKGKPMKCRHNEFTEAGMKDGSKIRVHAAVDNKKQTETKKLN